LQYIKIKNESLNQATLELINRCYFNKEKSIVIKPINGYEGENVFQCKTIDEIVSCINKIPDNHKSLLLSEYLNIENEYRVIYLNGQTYLIYKKEKPKIVGNGINTVSQLIKLQIPSYIFHNRYQECNKILKNNEVMYLNWKFNLSTGAIPVIEIDNKKLYDEIRILAIKAASTIGINFASIDIIKLNTGELKVLEINSGVVLERFMNFESSYLEIAFYIYEQAILAMFDNK